MSKPILYTLSYDTQPGVSWGNAIWPETGCTVLHSNIRIEQWNADGKWRAFGTFLPFDSAMEALAFYLEHGSY